MVCTTQAYPNTYSAQSHRTNAYSSSYTLSYNSNHNSYCPMSSMSKLTSQIDDTATDLDFASTSDSKIHRILALDRFSNLRVLNLCNQMISKIQNLPPTLTYVNLEFNHIQTVTNISHLVFLEQLLLSSNIICNLCDFSPLKSLKVLELAHNDLSVESINQLATCRQLSILSLQGNPLVQAITYKTMVGLTLGSLVLLDGQPLKRENLTLGDQGIYKSILKQCLEQKQLLVREAQRLKAKQNEVGEMVRNKIDQTKIQNIRIIEEIAREEERAQEIGDKYLRENGGKKSEEAGLVELVDSKYQESLMLERQLKEFQLLAQPTIQQQKARNFLLQRLINNEQVLQEYQNQLECLRQGYHGAVESERLQDSGTYSQLDSLHNHILRLRRRLVSNEALIAEYSNTLQTDSKSNQNDQLLWLMTKLVFGQHKQLTLELLEGMCQKYNSGILAVLSDLAGVVFGNEPSKQKIQDLRENLKGRALLDWFCDKNRSREKELRFLEDKENFILQFEKETQQLAQNWVQVKKAKEKHRQKVNDFASQQCRQQQSLKEKLKGITEQHDQSIKKDLEQHLLTLGQAKEELESLQERKTQISDQIAQLRKFKQLLSSAKTDLSRVKEQLRAKKAEVESYNLVAQNLVIEQRETERKCYAVVQRHRQKLNQLLDLEGQHRLVSSKLSLMGVQYSSLRDQLDQAKNQLSELQRLTVDEYKLLERTKTGVAIMEGKLDNLSKLSESRRTMVESLEKELTALSRMATKKCPSVGGSDQLLTRMHVPKNNKGY